MNIHFLGIEVNIDKSLIEPLKLFLTFLSTYATSERQQIAVPLIVPQQKQLIHLLLKLKVCELISDEYDIDSFLDGGETFHVYASPTKVLLLKNTIQISENTYFEIEDPLTFFDDGTILFKGEKALLKIGSLEYSLIELLSKNKNTSFTIKEIERELNKNIIIRRNLKISNKAVADAVRRVRVKLSIEPSDYFPVRKIMGIWRWEFKLNL